MSHPKELGWLICLTQNATEREEPGTALRNAENFYFLMEYKGFFWEGMGA